MNTGSTEAILYGIFLIILGSLYSRERFIRWILELNNRIRGVQSDINPTTIKLNRAIAWVVIILGVFMIMLTLIR